MTRSYKGTWTTLNSYVIDDVVLHEYKYYLALSDNSNSEPPNSNWEIITAIDSVCYILQEQMNLANGRLFIYNQDFKIPPISDLFVVVQYNSSDVMTNINKFVGEDLTMKEELTLLTTEKYTINLMSKNNDARLRKEEVLLALSSTFCEQQQEIYNIKIARNSNSFTNVSELEGAGMLNRFAIDIAIISWFKKEQEIEFYDNFTNSITTE
jgi:hypothetical protein